MYDLVGASRHKMQGHVLYFDTEMSIVCIMVNNYCIGVGLELSVLTRWAIHRISKRGAGNG